MHLVFDTSRRTVFFVEPSDLNSSVASLSIWSKPVNVLMKGGKKQTSAASAIFELQPNPNHAIINGVTAIPGVTLIQQHMAPSTF